MSADAQTWRVGVMRRTRSGVRARGAVAAAVVGLAALIVPVHGTDRVTVEVQARPAQRLPAPLATGSGVATPAAPSGHFFDITTYGALSRGPALTNQRAIDDALTAAAAERGSTVLIPAGEFKTYTVRLRSNVGLHLAAGAVLRAAIPGTGAGQDGGFYDAPEPNLFVGLQDHGHSHWANSLIYGIDVENIMISGPGLIDGGDVNAQGETITVLTGGDPREATTRTDAGVPGPANKAIALENARNIVFRDFSLRNGGHFAILGTGVAGWTIDGIIVDTNRDAIDIDASRDVTVRNSVFNALTDDAIVLKATYALGRAVPTENVLIENCTVSGYDAGSVIDRTFSSAKLVATDRDGPTARIKLGTEGTTGFRRILIRNVRFDRSRGFALESVDGAELSDIVLTDARMTNVSSSPIFIRVGDRGRAPVTGTSDSEATTPANTIRMDDRGWVLPALPQRYGAHPVVRYAPAYDKSSPVAIGNASQRFTIVSPTRPTLLNPSAVHPADPLFANAVGAPLARVRNVTISHVTVEDADPRYPILIAGLMDSPVENVTISDVSVRYRGGLTMAHAVEQRQLNQTYAFHAHRAAPATQSIPWLVNTFFAKNEALLPRIAWRAAASGREGAWVPDPYNVPEMPREYPEPSNFGILPAYGMYARHIRGLTVQRVSFAFTVEDERPAVVLDDVDAAQFTAFTAGITPGVPVFVKVTNSRKRETGLEYVKDRPYKTTTVDHLSTPKGLAVQEVTIDRPAPGTPPDSLYAHPTAPDADHPYSYDKPEADYPRPRTVYRPTFEGPRTRTVLAGATLTFEVSARTPLEGAALRYSSRDLPRGASFSPDTRAFSWTPAQGQVGKHTVRFLVDDDLSQEHSDVVITVTTRR